MAAADGTVENDRHGPADRVFIASDTARAEAVLSAGPAGAGLIAVDAHGVDPFVQMGNLEEILTGRPYEQVAAGQPDPVAELDGGQVLVAPLRVEVVDAIADLDDQRLTDVAATWAATEEFYGATDPEALSDLLRALRDLARARGTQRLLLAGCLSCPVRDPLPARAVRGCVDQGQQRRLADPTLRRQRRPAR